MSDPCSNSMHMRTEPLVFAPLVEAMFVRALGTRLTPICREHLRNVGLDLEKPLRDTYALQEWKEFLSITATHLYSGLPAKATYLAMGERLVDSLFEGFVGRGRLQMLRLLGPARALDRMSRLLKSNTNFIDLRRTVEGDSALRLTVNDVLADEPTFLAGCMGRLLQLAQAEGLSVMPEEFTGQEGHFRLAWSEYPLTAQLGSEATAGEHAASSPTQM